MALSAESRALHSGSVKRGAREGSHQKLCVMLTERKFPLAWKGLYFRISSHADG
jgi:hypothetical protein